MTIRNRIALAVVLGLFTFCLLIFTSNDVGITYDEPIYGGKGQQNVEWIGIALQGLVHWDFSPFSDESINHYWNAKDQHPALTKVVAGAASLALKDMVQSFAPMRAGTAFFMMIAVITLFFWATELWGIVAGIIAGLALLSMPRVFADAHLCTLDVPIMAMGLLTAYSAWKTATQNSWNWAVMTGLLFGLTLNTKINALFLPLPLLLWCVVYHRSALKKLLPAIFLLAPLVFYLTWPWLWWHTADRLVAYLEFHFRHYPVAVFYWGRKYSYAPWHYPLVLTVITTPALLLLASATGIGMTLRRFFREIRSLSSSSTATRAAMLWLVLLLTHLSASSLPTSPKYNGVRLFLSIFPFVSLLAMVSFVAASHGLTLVLAGFRPLCQIRNLPHKVTGLVGLVLLLPGLIALANIHPYEMSYYNCLIGGLSGAVKRGFEPTYWGDTYLGALPFFNRQCQPGNLVFVAPPGVESYIRMYQRMGLLRSDIRISGNMKTLPEARYAFFHTRQSEFSPVTEGLFHTATPVYQVSLEGVPLNVVYDREEIRKCLESFRKGQGG